jgi:hypothetical protein
MGIFAPALTGGVKALVPQDIGNLFQCRATLKHASGCALAEAM